MDQKLPALYKEYGQYSNYRNFPLDIDGLKPVERRVLLTAYKIARSKLTKCLKVSSYTNGNFHPHGECVTGDTKILLLDGTSQCIKDLMSIDKFWVYSCKKDGEVVPGLAHSVRITKKVTQTYKITLDNDKTIECTKDHLFMLRDGTYRKASSLSINDSLMPLYLREEDGYTFYKDNSRKICREEKVAWMIVRNLINEDIDSLIGLKKYHTHHKNEKRNDDRPENLELIFYKDHARETMKNRIAKDYNHTIKNIEIINLSNPIEVYDLTVEQHHNFAIDSGIFIHNCYGTIVQLVRQGFLDGQGNFGSNVGVEPTGAAAPRYTECKLSKRTDNLAFKYVDYVAWVPTEMDDKEPEFLPTMYPICLMGTEPTQGIGFGFRTYVPCYDTEDLHKRLLWLLGIRKRKPIITPITDCKITATSEEIEELLTTGKAKINVEGIIDVNRRTNTVTLRSWPPGKKFESFLNKISKELADGVIGFRDASVTQTEIVFQVMRERNRDRILDNFIEVLSSALQGTISYETIVIDNETGKVSNKSIDEMLLKTFKMFKIANNSMLTYQHDKISQSIAEYIALEMIRKPLSDCIKNEYDVETTLQTITKITGVPEERVNNLINKYRVAKLLTLNTDTSDLNNQLKHYEETLKNIDEFVLEQYGGFK